MEPKFRGGYSLRVAGRPARRVDVLPEPEVLHLPLESRRFKFSEICVAEGEKVVPGRALARDPRNFSVPLLAPRAGTVALADTAGHITLREPSEAPEEPYQPGEEIPHIVRDRGSVGMKRYKLLVLGAWQFVSDAWTGTLPDPFGTPSAVLVSTMYLEPFLARGDAQLQKRLTSFTRGIEHIQTLLEYQPITLIVPKIENDLGRQIREQIRGFAHVKLLPIPMVYPYDHPAVVARALGLKRNPQEPVWSIDVAGVLAFDRALTLEKPSTVRIISIGGPAVESPCNLKAMAGYPIAPIIEQYVTGAPVRVINGGVLTGTALQTGETLGLESECRGLTILPEHVEREFLSFVRPGLDRRSYSRCFLSTIRPSWAERFTTAMRGEWRACISCNYCEEVCPVGIMPHLIHKFLYQDLIEEAQMAGVERCMGCGLCSFVCPSKIELRTQMLQAQETIRTELQVEETHA